MRLRFAKLVKMGRGQARRRGPTGSFTQTPTAGELASCQLLRCGCVREQTADFPACRPSAAEAILRLEAVPPAAPQEMKMGWAALGAKGVKRGWPPSLWVLAPGLALALLCLSFLAGCATWQEKEDSIVGTVTCRQLVPIPTNAVVEVRLIERGGQAALAQTRIHAPRQWPIRFVLRYNPKLLPADQPCAVQASILVEGKPWMVTDTVNHFMEWGRIARAEVILQPVQ